MKTKNLFIAALGTLLFASCVSDEFIGTENSPTVANTETDAILFGFNMKNATRANSIGADAADLLGNKFYVEGVKANNVAAPGPDTYNEVFKTYSVEWQKNTAGTTESNTSDWEYVGKNHDWSTATSITSQTIKYWDYNTDYYNFCAYSLGTATKKDDGTPTGTEVIASPITYSQDGSPAYTLYGLTAGLSKCYITDMKTVAKAQYGNEVELQFRSLASKVRIALYETVPGYSVQNVYFYQDDATTDIATDISANTTGTLIGTFYTSGKYTINFPKVGSGNVGDSDFDKAHVTMDASSPAPETASTQAFSTVNYDAGFLKKNSYDPSFAGDYVVVLPNESGSTLELRVNYDLVSDDGGNERITVHGAKAFVPATFANWLPNYAYTYIFKISKNTNGWTSTVETDPAGLYPITFDAITLDTEETGHQTTITTVATPSITTYQKGHVYSASNEYKAGDIYIQVMNGSTLAENLHTSGISKLYTIPDGKTEADVLDALSIGTTDVSGNVTGRNSVLLTNTTSSLKFDETTPADKLYIPGEDDNNIEVAKGKAAKFDASANTTYAYVYDTGKWNGYAVTLAAGDKPTGWPSAYYTDPACEDANVATGASASAGTYYMRTSTIRTYEDLQSASAYPTGTTYTDYWTNEACTEQAPNPFVQGKYYRKITVDHKIYGVKVIKVGYTIPTP
ncbi:MAG: hypothetical protein IJ142_05300 [Bacteroidaceae bacterium]|nr:hypothetical protein [Bacteroidaceae bacterium]